MLPDMRAPAAEEVQWYSLRVHPQKEYVVAYLLRKQGVRTFVPTEIRTHKRSSYSKGKAEFAKPEHPCRVFAGIPGEPAWYDLLKIHLIIGPEGMNGKPCRLDPKELFEYWGWHALDGVLEIRDGLQMINVQGRGLVRSLNTRVRTISPRKRKGPLVVEVKGKAADFLSRFVLGGQV